MHICGIQKNDTDEPICKVAIEMQTQRTQTCHSGERRGWDELREEHGNIYIAIPKIERKWEFAMTQGTQPGAL